MTDTRHTGSAREDAIRLIESIDDFWQQCPIPASQLVDTLLEHPDLLQRLHEEQLSARADAIYAAMAWTGQPKDTVAAVIDHIPTDTLQRLHDERRMNDNRPAPRSIP